MCLCTDTLFRKTAKGTQKQTNKKLSKQTELENNRPVAEGNLLLKGKGCDLGFSDLFPKKTTSSMSLLYLGFIAGALPSIIPAFCLWLGLWLSSDELSFRMEVSCFVFQESSAQRKPCIPEERAGTLPFTHLLSLGCSLMKIILFHGYSPAR